MSHGLIFRRSGVAGRDSAGPMISTRADGMIIGVYLGFEQGIRAVLGLSLSEIRAGGGSGARFSIAEGLKPMCVMCADPDHVAPTSCPRAHGMTILGLLHHRARYGRYSKLSFGRNWR